MLLDQHGNPVTQEIPSSVWMDLAEARAHEQLQLQRIASMFPTLQGFLWDIKPKTEEHGG